MMSDSKEYQARGQEHWYVQLKDVEVPQVNYYEMGWKDRCMFSISLF
jgi:hypothetical protein